MTDHDAALAAALEALLPPPATAGDWEAVLASAQRPRLALTRRRRSVVVAVALALAVLVPLTALAVAREWWFARLWPSAPTPASAVVVVARGSWNGTPWALQAYRTHGRNGLCLALAPRGDEAPPRAQRFGASMSCGAPERELNFFATENRAGPNVFDSVAGWTEPDVARVEIVRAGETPIVVDTQPAPMQLDVPYRFYATVFAPGHRVERVVAWGGDGAMLASVDVPRPPAPPGTTTGGASGYDSWGGG